MFLIFLILTTIPFLYRGEKDNSDDQPDENNFRKGQWTAEEDAVLAAYVTKHGTGNWNLVQKNTGLARCGKSCRLRWTNHLRPGLRRGPFSEEEQSKVIELHALWGNKWSKIAEKLTGRTDNEIKNFWNTRIKKRKRLGLSCYSDKLQSEASVEAFAPSSDNSEAGPSSNVPHLTFNNFDTNGQNQPQPYFHNGYFETEGNLSCCQLNTDNCSNQYLPYNNQFQGYSMGYCMDDEGASHHPSYTFDEGACSSDHPFDTFDEGACSSCSDHPFYTFDEGACSCGHPFYTFDEGACSSDHPFYTFDEGVCSIDHPFYTFDEGACSSDHHPFYTFDEGACSRDHPFYTFDGGACSSDQPNYMVNEVAYDPHCMVDEGLVSEMPLCSSGPCLGSEIPLHSSDPCSVSEMTLRSSEPCSVSEMPLRPSGPCLGSEIPLRSTDPFSVSEMPLCLSDPCSVSNIPLCSSGPCSVSEIPLLPSSSTVDDSILNDLSFPSFDDPSFDDPSLYDQYSSWSLPPDHTSLSLPLLDDLSTPLYDSLIAKEDISTNQYHETLPSLTNEYP
ncbi:unnamed protein product [Sphenostylis stenocarpa]|uniref:Uncharacterized protein n=1 Tax=Sphenostylis stenocarpa TaxID=92480 RepID=A0AA86T3E9_9FABA|nr:unnamed protein product [Sphenostylis stenocarpa]